MTASAVGTEGQLGTATTGIRVFQPFFIDLNLPIALTRGDEVSVPVVVYNYLDKPQTVELKLSAGDGIELVGQPTRSVGLSPGEVRSESFRLRAKSVGKYTLEVAAQSGDVSDAVKHDIEVIADGRNVEETYSGTVSDRADMDLNVPKDVIDGSVRATLKIYPTTFSQVVEGLDSIFQMPSGCFEQTSSTTYPNILALDYLQQTKQSSPVVEAKARQYLHLGYQRLLSFEIPGGGFDWFGQPPANLTLSAYGLAEFSDMARVYDVDPALVNRTRDFILRNCNRDGSWDPELHTMHEDPTRVAGGFDSGRLATTAYIAAAVFANNSSDATARRTQGYLLSHSAEQIDDPYLLALVANALLAIDPQGHEVQPYVRRLEGLKYVSSDGKRVWWNPSEDTRTTFYGSGQAARVETTAQAVLALVQARSGASLLRPAMNWLIEQRDPRGTWYSTQATVLALRALLATSGKPVGSDQGRRLQLELDDRGPAQVISIPADQADVVQQLDLSTAFTRGKHHLRLRNTEDGECGYQLVLHYNVPDSTPTIKDDPLSIDVRYDRAELAVGDTLTATAKLANNLPNPLAMVMVDLPIPAGFEVEAEDFQKLADKGTIAKFQTTPRQIIVYLRALEPESPMTISYHLRARCR